MVFSGGNAVQFYYNGFKETILRNLGYEEGIGNKQFYCLSIRLKTL